MQPIQQIINEIKEKRLNVSEIARNTGIPIQRFHKWIRGENLPKTEDAEKLRHWASTNLEKAINIGDTSTVSEPKANYGKGQVNISMSTLHNLSQSNLVLAESNRKLVDNTVMLTSAYMNTTGGAEKQNELDVLATVQALQELTIEIYSKVNKTSLNESATLLGTKMVEKRKHFEKKGSRIGEGK